MSDLKEMILDLSQSNGTSGDEKKIRSTIKKYLSVLEFKEDRNGNLIAVLHGKGKTFLLDAHCDRIGLTVTHIESNGFLRVAKCGGMDARVLAAQDVTIWGKEPVYGVITSTPPHLSSSADEKKAKDFDEILIDTGLSKEEAEKLISAGDRITVKAPALSLMNNRISSPSLDNRAGCATIIKAAELVAKKEEHPTVVLLFSAQEETGGTGAITGGFDINADECISVDVSFADAPDMPSPTFGKLDGGAMIGYSPILNREISEKLKELAIKNNIPHTFEIMNGHTGTNADHIAVLKGGIKTGLVSIPLRNMHTGVEVISVNDVESCAELIASYILGGGLDA